MNWADQQPWETRGQWKERTFALHYGMGPNKLRDMLDQHGRMPQEGDTIRVDLGDGFADSFTTSRSGNYDVHFTPPSAEHQYRGRDDGYRSYDRQRWHKNGGDTHTELLLNTIEDWDMLGVELPKLIMVPTPNDEGVFVITRMEA